MKLSELFGSTSYSGAVTFPDCEVSGVTDNSKKIEKGCVFVCVKGGSFDGHTKAAEALELGAAAVVTERDLGLERQIIADSSRKCYGELCAAWFGHPERKMKVIGVTGTNGKTTMTNVIKKILTECGYKTGLIGTIQNEIGDRVIHTDNTTPMTYDYMSLLHQMAEEKCDAVVMEVSSFGLVQHRIGPTHFDVSVFTNLTQDHLDYHGTMEEYYKAKKMLFDVSDTAVINTDDEYGKRLFSEINCRKFSCSLNGAADFMAHGISLGADGTAFTLENNGKSFEVKMKMTGKFNVENVLEAYAACINFGIPSEKILPVIAGHPGVKGRCEIIPTGRDFTVLCDYAHTPDAVENILSSVREYCKGRLICLFGCGGDRDSTKRPLMAKAAAAYADLLIVTSDNPRSEEPGDIIRDILAGLEGTDTEYVVVEDRREAICRALELARSGDIIVLAGKGHEDYQILKNNVHIHFDEREVVAEGLKLLSSR
ncbi:UDP-N-acetylmuramoyl-L-alanyl-D-glutamate--2,6-diaminopimelate ligase [Ruminococcus sp. HUN007]|uniref:UDP-N-acetylmuramoyl-L-alanyl-D-glutamate--2, 6-diaminopimelate ligase n=1 Tax=Ruminococcus sp. HUN007 TaxID=1514668 RepID=UPI0005D1F17F|nr:UDP-N-acetylmuramoyl-L-alanyl-D-glutamate--2,6-diaminopimelate ligase [Ruminococcus sp. HUN007]